MASEETEVLVIGAGQAGLAMSAHLTDRGIPHIVLERHRIAERWRSERWDSLVANGPAWHDRFPELEIEGVDRDGFATKDQMVDYFVEYAELIHSPVRIGVEVTSVRKRAGQLGFHIETTQGAIDARYVVTATGAFQIPVIPAAVPSDAGLKQIHSSAYRNPEQLPEGGVLVVGAGSSGVQIADEIRRSGRPTYLSVGPHDRPPRSYRGHDFVWWLGVLGKWEASTPPEGADHVTIAVSGAHGGRTVDFRVLAASGITLLGRTLSYEAGRLHFGSDLAANVTGGDASYLALLDEADAFAELNGLDLPEEPEARLVGPDPAEFLDPTLEIDIAGSGIQSIVWATGYTGDYGWLQVDAFDDAGRPVQQRGVSAAAGLYFLGLPWQSRRGSSFVWGVWHDAKYVADQIAIQRAYLGEVVPLSVEAGATS